MTTVPVDPVVDRVLALFQRDSWASNEWKNGTDREAIRDWGEALSRDSCVISLLFLKETDTLNSLLVEPLCAALQLNQTLREIKFFSTPLSAKDVASLASALSGNSSVTSLSLSVCGIGSDGALALATMLKENSRLRTLDLDNNVLRQSGARAMADALQVNHTLTTLKLSHCFLAKEGVSAIAKALTTNTTLSSVELGGNCRQLFGMGAAELAVLTEALTSNKSVTHLSLRSSLLGNEGARALATGLETNRTITELDLYGNEIGTTGGVALASALMQNHALRELVLWHNSIGNVGAIALAEALRTNKGIVRLSLRDNYISDPGFCALCEALRSNSTVQEVRVGSFQTVLFGNPTSFYYHEATIQAMAAEKRLLEVKYVQPKTDTAVSVVFSRMLEERHRACMGWFARDYLLHQRAFNKTAYLPVAMALANDVSAALAAIRAAPSSIATAYYELRWSVWPVSEAGMLAQFLASASPADTTAARAVQAVVKALRGRSSLSVVNLHICGEGCAGKTTTIGNLKSVINTSWLLVPPGETRDIPLDLRTLGMVCDSVDTTNAKGETVRLLLHDYAGQESFRANHAAYLATPHSLYVIILPLWDKGPGPNHDKPSQLNVLEDTYTQWLKFINTIVVRAREGKVRCITLLNFSKRVPPKQCEAAIEMVKLVQDQITASPRCKLYFPDEPIPINSNVPSSVHKRLVTPLKAAIEELGRVPAIVAPCLQILRKVMAVESEWPLFCQESALKQLIRNALAPQYGPTQAAFPDQPVRDDIMTTIVAVAQHMLESCRDIILLPVHSGSGERVSINRPNWLTEKLLGSLFKPRGRQVGEAAPFRAGDEEESTHLLSAAQINEAGYAFVGKDGAPLDPTFLPRLLQHVGVSIPVLADSEGKVVEVAEGEALGKVEYWVPAFCTNAMGAADGALLHGAEHVVARQFKLRDADCCIFPPGYFSSLFVSIVSLYKTANRVWIFQDGMDLRADHFQVVVRQSQDKLSFTVTVATKGAVPGTPEAFATMQRVVGFVTGKASWRGNVEVLEFGLHPDSIGSASGRLIRRIERDMVDGVPQQDDQPYYMGMRRGAEAGWVALLQADVKRLLADSAATRADMAAMRRQLEEHQQKQEALMVSLTAQVAALCVDTEGLHTLSSKVESAVAMIAESQVENHGELCKIIDGVLGCLSEGEPAVHDGGERAACKRTASIQEYLQEIKDAAQGAAAEQMGGMKQDLMETLHRLAGSILSEAGDKLVTQQEAQNILAAGQLHESLRAELIALTEASNAGQKTAATDSADIKARLDASTALSTELYQQILLLRQDVTLTRTVQENSTYGVYDVPLLAIITKRKGALESVKKLFFRTWHLHFACPVCAMPAASGPEGVGYELLATKDWVRRVNLALTFAIHALRLVSLVTPLPLPGLGHLTDYLPKGAMDGIQDARKGLQSGQKGVKALQNAGGVGSGAVQQLQAAKVDARAITADSEEGAEPTPAEPVEITLDYVTAIREVLLALKEASPPKHTGLSRAVCRATGECAWVCGGEGSACRAAYELHGSACQKIRMVFK